MNCDEGCSKLVVITNHLIFGVVLPTADSFLDINFSYVAFTSEDLRDINFIIASFLVTPVVFNIIFQIWKFFSECRGKSNFDGPIEKWFTWIFVIFTIWPQWQALKLIGSIFCVNTEEQWKKWKRREKKYKTELYSIEPMIESIPQYIVKLCVWITLAHGGSDPASKITENVASSFGFIIPFGNLSDSIIDVFGNTTCSPVPLELGCIENKIWFPISMGIAFISSTKAIFDYLNNGPITTGCKHRETSCCYCCRCCIVFPRLLYVLLSFWTKSIIVLIYFTRLIQQGKKDIFSEILDDVPFSIWCLVLAITFICIPYCISMGPLQRNLGIPNFLFFCMQYPQAIMIPLVTDFAYGPKSGYGDWKDCACCKTCCFWYLCCCKKLRVDEKEGRVTLSNQLSWAKMAYSWLTAALIWVSFGIGKIDERWSFIEDSHYHNISLIVVLPTAMLLQLLTFTILLYCGEIEGEMNVEKGNEKDVSEVELEIGKIWNCGALCCGRRLYLEDAEVLQLLTKNSFDGKDVEEAKQKPDTDEPETKESKKTVEKLETENITPSTKIFDLEKEHDASKRETVKATEKMTKKDK